jgi:hypothetical protein
MFDPFITNYAIDCRIILKLKFVNLLADRRCGFQIKKNQYQTICKAKTLLCQESFSQAPSPF